MAFPRARVDSKDVPRLWKVPMYYFFDFYTYLDNSDVVLFTQSQSVKGALSRLHEISFNDVLRL